MEKHLDGERDRRESFGDSDDDSASIITTSVGSLNRSLRFSPFVQVAMLPWQEKVEARRARRGNWLPAPLSDELWDGESMNFRGVELTPEEFRKLCKAKGGRRKTPLRRAFAHMFSAAVENREKNGAHLSGVDIVHARARVYAEDFDEDDRDSNGHLEDDDTNRYSTPHIVMKLSASEIGEDDVVYRFEPMPLPPSSPPPPKPVEKRPSEKVTRFLPTPPSTPSPSQLLGLVPMTPAEPRKKSSLLSQPASVKSLQPFACGDGKRPLYFMGTIPIRDGDERRVYHEDSKQQTPLLQKKRKPSVAKMVLRVLFPALQAS